MILNTAILGGGTLGGSGSGGGSSSSSGGENYILAPEANVISAWNRYADVAGTSPVDGTAGSPNAAFTFALNTTAPLDTIGDFLLTKDANNRQGHGVSYDFSIENKWLGQRMQIKFLYKASANFAAGDLTVFVYDVTNAALVTVSNGAMAVSTVPRLHECFFTASATSTSYRLIIHVASTNALAYTANFASFFVGGDIAAGEWFAGAGTPEAAVAAPIGSVYQDQTNGILYVKRTGTGNTGWIQNDAANMKVVSQGAHGFVAGDWLYNNAGTYTKAIATSAAAAEVVGVVLASITSGTFLMAIGGWVSGLSGLTANSVHFLSDTTAGAITATEPTTLGYISKPLLIADATTSGYFINMRGQVVTGTGATAQNCVVAYDTMAGYGSTNTVIPYFTNKNTDTSSGHVTLGNDSTNGTSITIVTAGVYAMSVWCEFSTASNLGISLNSNQLTTSIISITASTRLGISTTSAGNYREGVSVVRYLAQGDIVRPHFGGDSVGATAANCGFSVTKVV